MEKLKSAQTVADKVLVISSKIDLKNQPYHETSLHGCESTYVISKLHQIEFDNDKGYVNARERLSPASL